MSHKAKVEEWLADARERLKRALPSSAYHREIERAIREYEQLLEQLESKREPGEDA
jgi:hypothetical protein